jgi:hypothetical protein
VKHDLCIFTLLYSGDYRHCVTARIDTRQYNKRHYDAVGKRAHVARKGFACQR